MPISSKVKATTAWVINIALIAVLAIAVFQWQTDDGPSAGASQQTTTTTAPPATDFVPEGPFKERIDGIVKNVDLTAYLKDADYKDWEIGVVKTISDENTMLMMVSSYIDVFYAASGCEDSNGMPEEYLKTLLDPGDVVLWDTAGGDHRLCVNEIRLIKEDGTR